MLIKAKEVKPNDPAVYMQLAGYYNRQGEFDKTIEALEQRAAEGTEQSRGVLHDLDLLLGQRAAQLPLREPRSARTSRRVSRRSNGAADQADYMEALVYKGLLAHRALGEESGEKQALIKEATRLQSQAETRKGPLGN